MANKKNGGKATKNETKNAQVKAEQVKNETKLQATVAESQAENTVAEPFIESPAADVANVEAPVAESSAEKQAQEPKVAAKAPKPAGVAALDALFADAGMSPASGKKKTDEYQTKNLAADKRVEGESINKQHEAWTEAYQKQRIAAVKLGKYRTAVLGLPAGIRKFSQGKFRPATGWEEAAKKLDPEKLKKYLEMEAAVEALA